MTLKVMTGGMNKNNVEESKIKQNILKRSVCCRVEEFPLMTHLETEKNRRLHNYVPELTVSRTVNVSDLVVSEEHRLNSFPTEGGTAP